MSIPAKSGESGIKAVADRLIRARKDGTTASAVGLEQSLPDADAAYAVQDRVAQAFGWLGQGPASHWKSGGGSRQATLTHAALAPDGVRGGSGVIDFSDMRLHTPGIEAEIALRLGRDVDPAMAAALTHEGAEAFIDAMAVSVELVDSRWTEGAAAPALLRLADAQSHGALALGAWLPYKAQDWSQQRCTVHLGGRRSQHQGTHPLGEPAWLLPAWLRHLTRHGASVAAGTVVTTGTWCGLLPAQVGDAVNIDFDGIGGLALKL